MASSLQPLILLSWLLAQPATPQGLPAGAPARLGEPQTRQEPSELSVAFSPNGRLLGWVTTERGQTRNNVSIHLWDLAAGKARRGCNFAADTAQATTPLVFSPDGQADALGTYHEEGGPAKITRNGVARVHVWNVRTAREKGAFPALQGGQGSEFRALAFSADGTTLSTVRDAAVQVWDVATGRQLRQFPIAVADEGGGISFEVLSADGKLFAGCVGNNPIHIWDVGTGTQLRRIRGGGSPAAFSSDGKLLAAVADRIYLWDVATGRQYRWLSGTAQTLAFSPDGKFLAWACTDGKVHVVEIATGNERHTFRASCAALAFSPDGRTLASACPDGTVLLWDVGPAGK
jgi:WD40 repeat protein